VTTDPTPSKPARAERTERARLLAALLLGGLLVAFALLNTHKVDVNWILGTWSTPVIVVIAASFALGLGSGALLYRGRARARRGR
jgi:uncharacterized integral membrane protein